jgi:gluconate 2-dehydrogenase gamma chain
MNRRKSIKALFLGTVSTGVLVEACETADKKTEVPKQETTPAGSDADRMPEEVANNKSLLNEGNFFTDHELETVAILSDIIIPKDEVSGSATEAKVPTFIDFMMKDRPEYQTPMRGGIRWLDLTCLKQYEKQFKDCSDEQKIAIVNAIAYPKKVKPEYQQGATFFSLVRNLTITGFYTSKDGLKDVGYVGNKPNQWNGVPDDVLKQYNMAYSEKELKEAISFDHA